ncbi:hypothetical protein GLOTRDRAFT_107745 [Gloeophyllum trabeum ATCC 11539]|uniref:NTF2-domain-containing protein n=1 Tax=Gloeophyllum trabeum (strain ATCC 11539 / FP-39264 / Madison 617) TaxID=670483 RepID=S7RII5_GLOTA|nr:uncharacterized protein GLOTRDRAFT_107745 [Gloeophyllum trabeum ATCC 11539]EPQ52409.1 hypothetical protein GLOTRDRAFT_107745 [Gloeophyllum trabeum ATCC 11539]
MTSTTGTNPAPSLHQNVVPSEVGWQFVPQYYTYVNQQPNRLHRFYTKASTFIHGVEGEDGKPCYGQQEIHNKITSIGFQDCKVFIHSVDAQSSASGGIIIQVIGEMSNRGEDWRKFVQTFFLAEQPNGYFVLNDIFRFLKEETVESDAASDAGESTHPAASAPAVQTAQTQNIPEPAPPAQPEHPSPPPVEREPSPAPAPVAATPVPEEAPKTVIPEPAPATPAPSEPEPHVNGNGTAAPEPEVKPEPVEAPAPVEPEPAPAPEPTTVSPPPVAPASLPPAPAPAAQPAQPTPAPQPAQPPQPKTWANLAANNAKKWGAAVATDRTGTSEVPASPVTPRSTSQTPVAGQQPRGPPGQHQQRDPQSAIAAAQNITHAQCFVKGVTENVSQTTLTNVLTQRFGPVKDVEIVRSKACAFLEFTNIDAAKRAIIASLPVPLGGEGGIRIDGEGGQPARIVVETKKERGERPPSNRPMNGPGRELRGGYRGRGGPGGGRGRGAPPQGK